MKKEIGLWIDHREAVIVTLLEKEEEIKRITSDVEKGNSSEDKRDNRLEEQLSKYYDEVLTHLQGADAIFIIGPGEAKGELEKRFEAHKSSDCVVASKTSDKMTDPQIVAEVRQHFQALHEGSGSKSQ